MNNFTVGPREQSIPEWAEELGSRWAYLRMFAVQPYKNQPHIVAVYRMIIHQAYDRNGKWIPLWAYAEDCEGYNNGKYRTNFGDGIGKLGSYAEMRQLMERRIARLQSLWPVLDNKIARDRIVMPHVVVP